MGIHVMIALELGALLPGLCVPGLQNWNLTVVSRKLNHAVSHDLIRFKKAKYLGKVLLWVGDYK